MMPSSRKVLTLCVLATLLSPTVTNAAAAGLPDRPVTVITAEPLTLAEAMTVALINTGIRVAFAKDQGPLAELRLTSRSLKGSLAAVAQQAASETGTVFDYVDGVVRFKRANTTTATPAAGVVPGWLSEERPHAPASVRLVAGKLPTPREFTVSLEAGALEAAREWVKNGLPADFHGDMIGTGLHVGAWEGNIDMMAFFIGQGVDINLRNQNGETPLALAVWRGQREAVNWLLAKGAKVSPLSPGWSPLHYAAFSGRKELVDLLLAKGADINARAPNGSSPLMMAVYEGHTEVAKQLVSHGADLSIKNDWGDGAFEWAMRYNRTDVAGSLVPRDEYLAAIDKPKETWGPVVRSQPVDNKLAGLEKVRRRLETLGLSTATVDKQIALAMQHNNGAAAPATVPRKSTEVLEVTASRRNPSKQQVRLVVTDGRQAAGR